MIITVIHISHLSSLPSVPNVKCIAWNFNGSNFVSWEDKKEDLKKKKFKKKNLIEI
jgi:REP element-mobilizing transposase RayT